MTSERTSHFDLALYLRVLREARPYWPHLSGVLLLELLTTPIALLNPVPLKIVVDSVLGSTPLPGFLQAVLPAGLTQPGTHALFVALGLLLVVALFSQVRGLTCWLLSTYAGESLSLAFRRKLLNHLQRMSLVYHDTHGTSDSVYRLQYDAPAIQWIPINGVIPLLTALATLTGMIYVTARLDAQIAVIALAVAPAVFVLSHVYRRRLRSRWRDVKDTESAAMAVAQEGLAAARVVKAFGQEKREQDRFVRYAARCMRGQLRVASTEGGFGLLVGLTLAGGTAVSLYIGVLHVQSGILTLGELLLIMAYVARLYQPVESLSRRVVTLQSSLVGAERAFSVLDQAPDVIERPHARRLSRATGAVEFRGVSFAYQKDHPVLHDFSFKVDPGTRVGIVGPTGAGKTTLVSLLIHFYDPTEGEILLDGVDLRDYKLGDLRNQFAIVLQDPVLFSTTVTENIAYGRLDATIGEIEQAAKAANAHDFIVGLPEGYETQVGERGYCLSGGQRQRISLARAFLRNSPILVLDEPTSSVDIETESLILEAMDRLMEGRTTFTVAHRPSTLTHCDVTLTLKDGRAALQSPSSWS